MRELDMNEKNAIRGTFSTARTIEHLIKLLKKEFPFKKKFSEIHLEKCAHPPDLLIEDVCVAVFASRNETENETRISACVNEFKIPGFISIDDGYCVKLIWYYYDPKVDSGAVRESEEKFYKGKQEYESSRASSSAQGQTPTGDDTLNNWLIGAVVVGGIASVAFGISGLFSAITRNRRNN